MHYRYSTLRVCHLFAPNQLSHVMAFVWCDSMDRNHHHDEQFEFAYCICWAIIWLLYRILFKPPVLHIFLYFHLSLQESTSGTPVTMRVDPKGFYLCWVDQNNEIDLLDIGTIRDVRTGQFAKKPRVNIASTSVRFSEFPNAKCIFGSRKLWLPSQRNTPDMCDCRWRHPKCGSNSSVCSK